MVLPQGLAKEFQAQIREAVEVAVAPQSLFLPVSISTVEKPRKSGAVYMTSIVLFNSRFGVLTVTTTYPSGYADMSMSERREVLGSMLLREMDEFILEARAWSWAGEQDDEDCEDDNV